MNSPTRKPIVPAPLTDAALDAALRDDGILPSSGFAASVMESVHCESAVAAGLPFPWKRAFPVLVLAAAAALGVLVLLIGAIVAALRHAGHAAVAAPSVPVSTSGWLLQLQPLLHSTPTADIAWPLLAVGLSGFCLLLCRRLLLAR